MTESYANGTFDACKQVSMPSTGQRALDMMCGEWGSSMCSPVRWFRFMGDTAGNSFVPFQINYRMHNTSQEIDSMTPIDPRVIPCSESPDGIGPGCSCVDCAVSCPKPPEPEPELEPFRIWGLDGYAVVMFSIFLLGSGIFLMGTACCSSNIESGKPTDCTITYH